MDIIESHQHGLAEQLAEEARGLAGRDRDSVQRAQVYHHLYQHSGGRHCYALRCAEAALTLDVALAAVERGARRRWRPRPGLDERARDFAAALRTIDRERCEAMLVAYRLAITPGLGAVAGERVPADLLAALRGGDRRGLFAAHLGWAEERWGLAIERAIAELGWPYRPSAVARAIAALRLPLSAFERGERSGWGRAEARLLKLKPFPPGFAANPGQHYYKLQRAIAERRRRERGALDLVSPEDSVSLAA